MVRLARLVASSLSLSFLAPRSSRPNESHISLTSPSYTPSSTITHRPTQDPTPTGSSPFPLRRLSLPPSALAETDAPLPLSSYLNRCQFFITTAPADFLDGKHSIFGRVIDGLLTVRKMENVPTGPNNRPKLAVKVVGTSSRSRSALSS